MQTLTPLQKQWYNTLRFSGLYVITLNFICSFFELYAQTGTPLFVLAFPYVNFTSYSGIISIFMRGLTGLLIFAAIQKYFSVKRHGIYWLFLQILAAIIFIAVEIASFIYDPSMWINFVTMCVHGINGYYAYELLRYNKAVRAQRKDLQKHKPLMDEVASS